MGNEFELQFSSQQPFSLEMQEPVRTAGATNYEQLNNKPQINGVELSGNKTTEQLGIQQTRPLSNLEIYNLLMN